MEKFINNKMNTLLVSEKDSDYETLVKYGFENVTYFKSPIIALEYFWEHPEIKEQYELIICGDTMADKTCFENPNFSDKIKDSFQNQNCYFFDKYYYGSDFEYRGKLYLDKSTFRNLDELFDKYLDDTEIKESNKEFKQVSLEEKEMTLPKKIEDIKVLFLQSGYSYRPETNAQVLNNIGIKTFALTNDNNPGLQKNAVSYLGYYDIIIASMTYSRELLDLEKEVLEQNKYRDNGLTMLVCKDVGGCYEDFHVAFECSFVSNNHDNLPKKEKNYFNIFSQNEEYIPNEYFLKTVIRRYIDELNKINDVQIDTTNLPSVEDMIERRKIEAEERERKFWEAEKQKEEQEKPLKTIEHIRTYAKKYLNLRRNGIYLPLEGLEITEKNNYITVYFTIQNKKMCAISFSKNVSSYDDTIKLFALQTISKKGNLSDPTELAVYLSDWDNNSEISRKPTDEEWSKIEGIKKRVDKILVPIVEESIKNYNNDKPKSYRKRKKYYRK